MANVIDILVTRQAQKELEKIVENLKKAHDEIVRINQTGLNINGTTSPRNPADLNNLIRQNEELARKYRELEERLSRLNAQRQASRQRTSEEIVNQRELAQNADRQTRATSALVGAYNNLNAQHQIASRRLQDLIARGRTANQTQSQYNREIREAQTAFQGLDRRIQSADRAVGRFNRNVGNYRQAFSGLRDLIGAFGIAGGVTLFAGIATSVFQTTKELQSLDNALKQVSGTQEQMARSQAFLREVSEAYGLEINSLTKQFTQFYVSAKDKISATEIENIFRSVSKAGATMGLSVENQERAFLALNQMMSKGVVSAEELRGQLGEALPGAFGIMAKAVGVTEVELSKLMKDGKLLADEVLPKFARELEKVYGIETIERVETLTASQNRLKNSWTELVRSLNESETGGISQFFKFIVDGLNKIANLLIRVNTSWNDLYKQAGAKGEKAGKKFFDENIRLNSSDVELTAKERASIKKRIDEIKSLIASGYNDPKFQKELNELNRKLNPSAGQAESLSNTADKNIDKYTDKIIKLNEQLKKTEEQQSTFLKRTFNPNFGKSEKDLKEEIERANFDLAYWKQVKESADNYGKVIEEVAGKELKLTTAKKENVKVQKEEEQLIFGTEAWLKKQISLLEETRSKTSTTSEAYREIGGGIAFYAKWLETLTGAQKKSNEETEKTLKYGTIEYYESLQNELKALQQTQVENNEEFDKFQKQIDFYQTLINAIKGAKEETKELEKANTDYFDSFIDSFTSESGFSKTFDLIKDNFKLLKEGVATAALAISEAFQEAFNTIAQASQNNFDAEYSRLEQQKNISLQFAGESATAREEIERQYEERKKAIQRREAEAQKRLAIFNIETNTAQAVLATYAKVGFPVGIPLAIAMGAIGAAQIALVSAQEIPQFWKGTENAPAGLAWTQEKGAEVITDKKGNVKTLGNNKGAQLTYLEKGDKVYKSHQDYINKTLVGAGIQPMRSTLENFEKNNSLTTQDFNNGISKLAKTMQSNKGSNTQVFLNNKQIDTNSLRGIGKKV
jgi:tape measure domain-containing protein